MGSERISVQIGKEDPQVRLRGLLEHDLTFPPTFGQGDKPLSS
jgi:hypothetical protein